jgi:predicted transcriptional regulator
MNTENKIALYILEAAIDGITKERLLENTARYSSEELSDYISILMLHELVKEYSDRGRNFVAFKTTQKGVMYLMNAKTLHSSPVSIVEA